ncbi:MAG TPA: hypothetical protein VGD43_02765, partial [Micromonospora sp.]
MRRDVADPRNREAAGNNAEWCDLVCRTHGGPGRFDAYAWTTGHRSPPGYPDAVTLRPDADSRFLDRIDMSPGASVKDSFGRLDLSAYGFRPLFDAEWIRRDPDDAVRVAPGPAAASVRPVTTPAELAGWATAHGGGAVFRPALLDDPRVTVLAVRDPAGAVCGGAV